MPISIYSRDVRSSLFAPNYEEEHLERRVDALNTLYVAFTRAECNLYVWGKIKSGTAGDLIYKTLRDDDNDTSEELFAYEVGKPFTEVKKEGKKEGNRLHLEHRDEDAIDVKVVTRNPKLYFQQSNLTQDYLERMKDEEASTDQNANEGAGTAAASSLSLSQREIGKLMHEALSRINDVSQLDEVLREAREGSIGKDEEWDTIASRIKEGFRNPLVASWFREGNTVYNECGIASISEKDGLPCVLRPDRVVMTDDSISVIDYKFGHPNRDYGNQVRRYMNLMKQMYPGHNVKGHIWYIMLGKIQNV